MIRKLAFVTIAAALGVALVGATTADVTFVLKNGDRVSGNLVYRHTTDFTVVRDGREQTFPSDDIALIQFVPGDPSMRELEQLPNVDNNPNELERHVFVFRNGTVMRGKLHDIIDNRFDFDAQAGGRRTHDLGELARLYFNPASARRVYHFDEQSTGRPGRPRPLPGNVADDSIRVDANRPWTSTGISVTRGERIAFETTGEIRVGPSVSAGPDGNADLARRASYPVRSMPVGGLVARVGTSAPFPIGSNRSPITMPMNGELRLGINDDVFTDNSGFYTVRVIRADPGPSRIIRGAIR
jgi:hypothetical protein